MENDFLYQHDNVKHHVSQQVQTKLVLSYWNDQLKVQIKMSSNIYGLLLMIEINIFCKRIN